MQIDIYHKYELTVESEYSVNESEYRYQDNFVTHKHNSTQTLTGNQLMTYLRAILEDRELDSINFKQNSIYITYMNPDTGESGETTVHVKELPFFED